MTIAVIVIIIVLILVGLASRKKSPTTQQNVIAKNQNFYVTLINGLPEPGKSCLARLKKAYDENLAMTWNDLKSRIQIPDTIDNKNSAAIKQYLKITSNESAQDLYTTFMLDISQRYRLQYKPLLQYDKVKALQQFKINIGDNEVLYQQIRSVEWNEEKIVRKNINYSGYSWTTGNYHNGTLSYSSQVTKDFQLQDIGSVYLTNKRIIFIGKYKNVNKSLAYDKILNFKLYQDGILLGLSNSKLPLLKFFEHDNTNVNDPNDAFITNDGMNQLVRVISRILTGTQDKDLQAVDS